MGPAKDIDDGSGSIGCVNYLVGEDLILNNQNVIKGPEGHGELKESDDPSATLSSLSYEKKEKPPEDFLTRLRNLGLIGRENEAKMLTNALDRVVANGESEGLFISGESGQGKSRLVEVLRLPAVKQGGYCMFGKFEKSGLAPFSAIAATFSDLVDLLCQRHDAKDIGEKLRKALGAEWNILANVVSNLPFLLIDNDKESDDESSSQLISSNNTDPPTVWSQAFIRFKQLCGIFLKTISAHCTSSPIILVLDDVQWADSESLEIMQSLIQNTTKTPFLHIWMYRVEEHNLDLLTNLLNQYPSFAHLPLEPISCEVVNSIIAEITGVADPRDTLELASVVEKKTSGNIVSCQK